jgi:hypothetical protein
MDITDEEKQLIDNCTKKHPDVKNLLEPVRKSCKTCSNLKEHTNFKGIIELIDKYRTMGYFEAHIVDSDNKEIQYCEDMSSGGVRHYFQIPNPYKSICQSWQLDKTISKAQGVIRRKIQEDEEVERLMEIERDRLKRSIAQRKKDEILLVELDEAFKK